MHHNLKWMWSFIFRGKKIWACLVLATGMLLPRDSAAVGTWTYVNSFAPDFINTMLLLPDGTVMCANGSTNWYRLTPDSTGSYVNGTWSTLASMHYQRLYFSSQVLTNGQVFIAGGEYSGSTNPFVGPGTTNAEIYNPIANTWTVLPNPI